MTDTSDAYHQSTVIPQMQTGEMFDLIAPAYDILNHILSLGLDLSWRKKLAALSDKTKNIRLLDLATGTGDLLIALLQNNPCITEAVGLDISSKMLALCREKITRAGLLSRTSLVLADVTNKDCIQGSFDLVTIGFGIRNTPDVINSLETIHRLLETGGQVLILEFTRPNSNIIGSLYKVYLHNFIPFIGGLLSGQITAYRHLSKSINDFYSVTEFCELMKQAGFENITATPLTFGVACIYSGTKL